MDARPRMDAPHADVPATRHSGTVEHSASVLVASEHFNTRQKSFHDDVCTYLLFFFLFFVCVCVLFVFDTNHCFVLS